MAVVYIILMVILSGFAAYATLRLGTVRYGTLSSNHIDRQTNIAYVSAKKVRKKKGEMTVFNSNVSVINLELSWPSHFNPSKLQGLHYI